MPDRTDEYLSPHPSKTVSQIALAVSRVVNRSAIAQQA